MLKRVTHSRAVKKKLPSYTYLGCPLTKNLSGWCFRLCRPKNGLGFCGRVAPHSLRGHIQLGIDRYKATHR